MMIRRWKAFSDSDVTTQTRDMSLCSKGPKTPPAPVGLLEAGCHGGNVSEGLRRLASASPPPTCYAIWGYLHSSLYLTFLISKLGALCPGDPTGLSDQRRLLWESWNGSLWECGRVVVNDLLIRCELSLMCHLNCRHPLFLQPDQGCGFIIRTCFLL